jgi:DNA-binding beta-propeller fold protein YncE
LRSYPVGALNAPTFVVFSPDGRFVAVDLWMSVLVFNGQSRERLAKIPLGMTATALVWSPYPTAFGVAVGSVARVIQVPAGTTIAEFTVDAKVGKYLAVASTDRSARVFDIASRAETTRISRPHPLTAVAFGPDGRLAIGDESHTVQFWSPPAA